MKQFSKDFYLVVFAAIALFVSCKKEDEDTTPGTLEVEFNHRWGTQVFNFGQEVVTPAGDSATFTTFKYYVSNFKLIKDDGTQYPIANSYYLIDHDSVASTTLTFKGVPAGKYTGVTFLMGIDSAKSTSPLDQRTGILDPATGAKGMYWAWNSGYIFTKLEGISPSAPIDSAASGKRRFWYHIGGFGGFSSKTINNLKTVTINSTTDAATVNGSSNPSIHMIVDVKEFFQNPTNLSIKANPIVMFAPYSTTIADNYMDMIRLDHIHN